MMSLLSSNLIELGRYYLSDSEMEYKRFVVLSKRSIQNDDLMDKLMKKHYKITNFCFFDEIKSDLNFDLVLIDLKNENSREILYDGFNKIYDKTE